MKKNRAAVILFDADQVALIKRTYKGTVYFVFPGGGIEDGENPGNAAEREAFEELGVRIQVLECLVEVKFNGTQYFYLARIQSGVFGTGTGDEFKDPQRNRGLYEPVWLPISELDQIDVRPREVAHKIQMCINDNPVNP